MLRIQPTASPYRVILPKQRDKQDILALAQAFMRCEAELPVTERTPLTTAIEAILEQGLAAQTESQKAEVERRAASEAVKRLDVAAFTAVRQIRHFLVGYFTHTPEQAQAWGFTVRQTGRSAGHIFMPDNQEEIRICLHQYVEAELARPAAERFTVPALADMIALHDNIQQQWQSRDRAEQRRLQANAKLGKLCQQLSDQLRIALSYLIMVKFDGQGNRQLGHWGFKVVARTPGTPALTETQPPTNHIPETVLEPV